MATGYRDGKPDIGTIHHAFRTISDIKKYLKDVEAEEDQLDDLWTIHGTLIADDGDPDGLQIKVESFERLYV